MRHVTLTEMLSVVVVEPFLFGVESSFLCGDVSLDTDVAGSDEAADIRDICEETCIDGRNAPQVSDSVEVEMSGGGEMVDGVVQFAALVDDLAKEYR